MEDLLNLYKRELNPKEPVVCLDEKSTQLLAEVRAPLKMRSSKEIKKRDYEYKRCGTANIFCGVEPKAGQHFTKVTKNRKRPEFAKMIAQISRHYPSADRIHLVIDNLNTHGLKSLTDLFGEKAGKKIWDRFKIHPTPVHASWLNQAEIEISMLVSQCLGKDRIDTLEKLKTKVKDWNHRVNRKKTTINWLFTTAKARKKWKYKKVEIKLSKH